MKLFWRSIVFLAVASVAPLAFGQATTQWQTNNGTLQTNQSGNFNDASRWTSGIPNPTTSGIINVFNFNTTDIGFNGNNNITVAVPAGQSAASLIFQEEFNQSAQGTINLNIAPGATLTLGGGGLSGSQPSLFTEFGVITTISGSTTSGSGALSIASGPIDVGNANPDDFDAQSNTLNLTQLKVNIGSNNSINVAPVNDSFTGTETGVLNQTGTTTITAGNNFSINIGTTGTFTVFGQGNGTYNLTNKSSITLGTGSMIQIGTGTLNQDLSSTISLGAGSTINVGVFFGDSAIYNLAGNLNLSNGALNVGTNGSVGTINQSSGIITGDATLDVGDGFGTGVYNFSGGAATFSQSFTVGFAGGTGTFTQSGSAALTVVGVEARIGTNGGTGIFDLQNGTADFQGGVLIGGGGTLTQEGSSILTAEGFSELSSGATYVMGGASATFSGGMLLDGTLDLNSGILSAPDNNFGGTGILNFGGGTLQLTSVPGVTDYTFVLPGTLTGGTSTIDVSQAGLNTFTFQNTLTGTNGGGINLIGSGTTQFFFASIADPSVHNSYPGSTSIDGGTLFATQNDVTTTSALNIGSTGTLNLKLNAGGMAFTGPVTGAGTLALQFNTAGDAFVLPNANGFSGTVALGVNSVTGTFQVYNGNFANITDNGTGSSVEIGGQSLVTTGTITVPFSGTVFLPGANTYTGLTTINSGFTVAASNFSGNVTYAGGLATSTYPFAAGASSTPSALNIAGSLNAVAPPLGAAPPTLFIFTNGQTADIFNVGDNNFASSSVVNGLINVKGSGTGTFTVVQTNLDGLHPGLLTTGSGTLSVNAPGSLFSYTAAIDPTNSFLFITTTQGELSAFAQTPAQKAVAASLDPLTQSPPPAFAPLLTIFNNLSASQIPLALGELSTQSLQFSRNIAFENSTYMVQRLDTVLANLRSGYEGLDLNSITCTMPGFNSGLGHSMQSMLASNAPSFHTTAPNGVNYYPDDGSAPSAPNGSDYQEPATPSSRMTPSQSASPTTYDGQVLSDSPVPMGSAPPDLRTSRFSEFVAGDVVLADINQNAQQDIPSKATYTAGDISAGVSYRMTSNLSVGVLLDYSHTNATTDGNGSKTTVNSITPGIYATFFEKGFYANGLFAYGFNDYNNSRNVSFLGGTANSSPTGQQYTANIDFGYDFHPSKQWVVGPTLGLTYTHLDINSFSESGVPLADLNVNSQNLDSLRSRLGGHVEYMTRVGSVVLQPSLTAMWQHEFLDNGAGITSSWQAYTAAPFTTPIAAATTDSALLGCGLTATLDNSMAFFLNYLADVGGSDYLTQTIYGGVKASF